MNRQAEIGWGKNSIGRATEESAVLNIWQKAIVIAVLLVGVGALWLTISGVGYSG